MTKLVLHPEKVRRSFLRIPDRWRRKVGWVAGVAVVLGMAADVFQYQATKVREEFQKHCDIIADQQCRDRGFEMLVAACNFYGGPGIPPGLIPVEPDIAVKRAIPVTQSDK